MFLLSLFLIHFILIWLCSSSNVYKYIRHYVRQVNEPWVRVEIRHPGSEERKISYFKWLVSCTLIRLNLGMLRGEKKMSRAATGKANMSRASLGLWLWD